VSDHTPQPAQPDPIPEVEIKERNRISIVWLIPLVAGAVAIWLAYTTISEEGPSIHITFKTAEGLEAGKTKVKYKDVEIGQVENLEISDDLSHIQVTANLKKGVEPHLNGDTRFWVVRPRFGAGGVTGLGTLVSGAYIEMDPGKGNDDAREFVGLEVPPEVRSDVPGRKYLLEADQLGSLGPGSPIYFRGLEVGEVMGFELAADNQGVLIPIFVRAPHDRLVQDRSRFWNASGVDISVSADGVNIGLESMQALLLGGIVFDTPVTDGQGTPSAEGTSFRLHKTFASTQDATYTEKEKYLLHFDSSVRGLSAGAPVELRGIRVGTVTDVHMEYNADTRVFKIPVTIEFEPQRVQVSGQRETDDPYAGAEALVRRGLRAQLKSGNLITGQLLVSLDFHPDSPPAELIFGGAYPEIPTVPSQLDEITRSVSDVLDEVSSLPLKELVGDLRRTVQGMEKLVNAPQILESMESLNNTLNAVEDMSVNLDREVTPLVAALRDTVDQTQSTLGTVQTTFKSAEGMIGNDSQIRYDLTRLLQELTETARSVRFLADYLEQNPNALISGKGGQP